MNPICNQVLGLRKQGISVTAAGGNRATTALTLQTGRGFIYGLQITAVGPGGSQFIPDPSAVINLSINGVQILENEKAINYTAIYRGEKETTFVQAQTPGGVELSVVLDNTAGADATTVNVTPLYSQDRRLLINEFIPAQA